MYPIYSIQETFPATPHINHSQSVPWLSLWNLVCRCSSCEYSCYRQFLHYYIHTQVLYCWYCICIYRSYTTHSWHYPDCIYTHSYCIYTHFKSIFACVIITYIHTYIYIYIYIYNTVCVCVCVCVCICGGEQHVWKQSTNFESQHVSIFYTTCQIYSLSPKKASPNWNRLNKNQQWHLPQWSVLVRYACSSGSLSKQICKKSA